MDRLEKILKNIGLEEQQVLLFADLSKHGPATIMELATRIGMKRPTVHFHVEQLLEEKLLEEEQRAGKRLIMACQYEKLKQIVQSRLQEAESTGEMLAGLLDEAEALGDINKAGTIHVTIEEGVDAVLEVYHQAASAQEVVSFIILNASKKISEIRPLVFNRKLFKGFSFKEYGPEGPAEEMTRFSWYSFRHSPVHIRGAVCNVLVFGHKVVLISAYERSRLRVLSIEQPSLAEVMRGLLTK